MSVVKKLIHVYFLLPKSARQTFLQQTLKDSVENGILSILVQDSVPFTHVNMVVGSGTFVKHSIQSLKLQVMNSLLYLKIRMSVTIRG